MTKKMIGKGIRGTVALFAMFAFTACDDDNGSGPGEQLQPQDVASVYRVCQLTFDPAGSVLPAVDIRTAAFELPGTSNDPVIGLDPDAQRTVELTYVPKGQVNDRELRGNYNIRGLSTVELRFNTTGVDPKTLLIPDNRRMDFHFQASPRRLSLAASSQYNVTRAAYVELSGEDPQNIPEAVAGVLVAQFRTDPCS